MTLCWHTHRSVPHTIRIKAEGTQEIIGEATIRVCFECGQAEGTVSNGSLLTPSGSKALTVPADGDIGVEARKILVENQSSRA
jgi:hypothetical protein